MAGPLEQSSYGPEGWTAHIDCRSYDPTFTTVERPRPGLAVESISKRQYGLGPRVTRRISGCEASSVRRLSDRRSRALSPIPRRVSVAGANYRTGVGPECRRSRKSRLLGRETDWARGRRELPEPGRQRISEAIADEQKIGGGCLRTVRSLRSPKRLSHLHRVCLPATVPTPVFRAYSLLG